MAKRDNPLHIDGEVLALSLLTLGEAAHAYSSFMPSRFTIKNWVLEGDAGTVDDRIANLRSGYIPSLTMSLGIGAVISYLAKSPLPLVFAAGTSAVMTALYEGALPPEKQLHRQLLNGQSAPLVLETGINFI